MNGKQWNDTGGKAYVTSAAVEEARRVVIDSNGEIAHADETQLGDGVTEEAGAAGATVNVILFNKPGTIPITGSEAIALGEPVFAAADGKVSELPVAAATYFKVGKNAGNYATTADLGVVETLVTPDAGNAVVVT